MLRRVQEWLADRGWMQYPLPRRRRLRVYYEPGEIALRLVVSSLGLFWGLVLLVVLAMQLIVAGAFILAVMGF
ncbi:MAG: hypothetical protein GC190_21915 [Alphaproteobacteria bacterium]|nr:hypothetical protein [Alphaproteobacteria bacterium]